MRQEVHAVDSEQEAEVPVERFVPVGLSNVIAAREGTAGRDVKPGEMFWVPAGEQLYEEDRGLVAVYSEPRGGNPGTRQSWQAAGYATLDPVDGHPSGERCPRCSGPAGASRRDPGEAPAARRARPAVPQAAVPPGNGSRR